LGAVERGRDPQSSLVRRAQCAESSPEPIGGRRDLVRVTAAQRRIETCQIVTSVVRTDLFRGRESDESSRCLDRRREPAFTGGRGAGDPEHHDRGHPGGEADRPPATPRPATDRDDVPTAGITGGASVEGGHLHEPGPGTGPRRFEGREQHAGRSVFQHVARGTCSNRFRDSLPIGPRREQQHRRRICESGDLPSGVDTVHDRHRQIHKDQIRRQAGGEFDRLVPVGRFADHHELLSGTDQADDACTDTRMIIDYQDPRRLSRSFPRRSVRRR
jgi:hypothetical protein